VTAKAARASKTPAVAKCVQRRVELFCDFEGEPFAAIDGIANTLDSREVRALIVRLAHKELKQGLSKSQVDEVIAQLGAVAISSPTQCATHVRLAQDQGAIWLDLGPQFARVTADGWTLRDTAPVMFRRPAGWLALPIPERGGSLAELRELLAFEADGDAWILCAAWLVGALQVGRPYAALAFADQQGRGKTVRARLLRNLIDPNLCDVERPPSCSDDLFTAVGSAHVVVYDNLSALPEWLADDLCCVATGGALRKRKLYTNSDVSIVRVMKPLILTGIAEITRSDLASRCLRVELGPLTRRRTEAALTAEYDAAKPRMLGALLDAVACSLRRLDETTVDDLPRLADFARWATAAEPGLGLPDGAVFAAMQRAETAGAVERAEGTPLQKLLDALTRSGPWKGEPSAALERLRELHTTMRAVDSIPPEWRFPASANALSSQLRRAAPDLRKIGFTVDLDGCEGRDRDKRKVWTFDVEPGSMGSIGDAAA
jgi:hypothetical protein